MQQKDKMHPDDMRNLILFGILSLVLWLSYDHFILQPKMEKMRATQEVKEQILTKQQENPELIVAAERPREDVLQEGSRIEIKSDLVYGSVNLTGARLDDLSLTTYFKTIEKKENSVVLSPVGSPHPKYVEQGWVSADPNIKVPDSKTQWRQTAGDVLSPSNPVTLSWNNEQGLRFEKVISINEDYGFSVIERVINNTRSSVTLFPYGLVAQRGVPEEFLGRWIVHEGPIGYFGDELFEETYGKMDKTPVVEETANQGWVGLTSKNWLRRRRPY